MQFQIEFSFKIRSNSLNFTPFATSFSTCIYSSYFINYLINKQDFGFVNNNISAFFCNFEHDVNKYLIFYYIIKKSIKSKINEITKNTREEKYYSRQRKLNIGNKYKSNRVTQIALLFHFVCTYFSSVSFLFSVLWSCLIYLFT